MSYDGLAKRGTETVVGSWWIDLADCKRLAIGTESEVYERPGKPSQLIKVMSEARLEQMRGSRRLKDRIRTLTQSNPHRKLVREYRETLGAAMAAQKHGRSPPLAQPRGFVLTDRGVGQLIQKIRAADGSAAPTLAEICGSGRLDDKVLQALNDFARDLYALNIVVFDLFWKNLVFETHKGRSRFVLIDGYGSRTLIPVRRWSRRLNSRKLDGQLDRLGHKAKLRYDAGTRCFLWL